MQKKVYFLKKKTFLLEKWKNILKQNSQSDYLFYWKLLV